jgi:hypothetical protein
LKNDKYKAVTTTDFISLSVHATGFGRTDHPQALNICRVCESPQMKYIYMHCILSFKYHLFNA